MAGRLVGSIRLLVQNVVLLNSDNSFPLPLAAFFLLSFLDGHVFLSHPFVLCKTDTHYILPLHRASQTQLSTSLVIFISYHRVILSLSIFDPPSGENSLILLVSRVFFYKSCFPTSRPLTAFKYVSHSCEHVPQVDPVDSLAVIPCHLWYTVPCSLLTPIVPVAIFIRGWRATHLVFP